MENRSPSRVWISITVVLLSACGTSSGPAGDRAPDIGADWATNLADLDRGLDVGDVRAPLEVRPDAARSADSSLNADVVEVDAEVVDTADSKPVPPEFHYSVKADNVDLAEVLPLLEPLATHGLDLFLGVRPWHVGTPELAAVLETAASLGISVKLWPLLDWNDGSWCCEDTLELCVEHIGAVLDGIEPQNHSVDMVVVNMELAHPKIDQIKQAFSDGDLDAAKALLLANYDPAMFAESQAGFQALVDSIHARGFPVLVNTYPFILDDFADGDNDVQDLVNVPIAGISWDRYSFTAYTSSYSADTGVQFGPYYPYTFGLEARSLFGDAVEIAVGITGPEEGSLSPAAMALDVAAVKAAGVTHISVYNLAGIAGDDFATFAAALEAEPQVPPPDQGTELMHMMVQEADAQLD